MSKEEVPSKQVMSKMLTYALVEIRSSDDMNLMKALADIFHNLPVGLVSSDECIDKESYEMLIRKAKKWKLESYIYDLMNAAKKRVR